MDVSILFPQGSCEWGWLVPCSATLACGAGWAGIYVCDFAPEEQLPWIRPRPLSLIGYLDPVFMETLVRSCGGLRKSVMLSKHPLPLVKGQETSCTPSD